MAFIFPDFFAFVDIDPLLLFFIVHANYSIPSTIASTSVTDNRCIFSTAEFEEAIMKDQIDKKVEASPRLSRREMLSAIAAAIAERFRDDFSTPQHGRNIPR